MYKLAHTIIQHSHVWNCRKHLYATDSPHNDTTSIAQFYVTDFIGAGGHGNVYQVVSADISQRRAVLKCAVNVHTQTAIDREVNALQAIVNTAASDFVTPLLGTCQYFSIRPTDSNTYTGLALVRPKYATILDSLDPHFTRIITIIKNLHAVGWIHGDIKINNFFAHPNTPLVLGDFSSAQPIQIFNPDDIECSYLERNHMHAQLDFVKRSPQLIDLYGYCLMVYSHLCQLTQLQIDWGTSKNEYRLPFRHEIANWQPACDQRYHNDLKTLFLTCSVP